MKIEPAQLSLVQAGVILLAEPRVVLPFMLCSCIASSLALPTNSPLPLSSLFEFFLWPTHKVLKLGPKGFYGAELVSDLESLAKDTGRAMKRRLIKRTVMILSKFRLRRLMFWRTCSMLCRKWKINSCSIGNL